MHIKFLLKSYLLYQSLFIKFRKQSCKFLIPVVFLTYPLFLIFFETVNARNYAIKLTCDVKTHSKQWKNHVWSDLGITNWNLEIDYKNNLLVRRQNFFYQGKNYPLTIKYSIVTNNRNKIVAFDDDLTTSQDGLGAGTMTLDLISRKLTASRTLNDERGYAFSLYYGKCFKR